MGCSGRNKKDEVCEQFTYHMMDNYVVLTSFLVRIVKCMKLRVEDRKCMQNVCG